MQIKQLSFESSFEVVAGNSRAEAAVMVIQPGRAEGGPQNRHRGSDQWLYVVEGEGIATVSGKKQTLGAGALLLIERGETHEILATGAGPLRTLNFYAPPAYGQDGETLPAGES